MNVPQGGRTAPTQIVVREFPDIGKYKIRLVQKSARDARLILDIREYASGPNYQGFTRRGVRLMVEDEVPKLAGTIDGLGAAAERPTGADARSFVKELHDFFYRDPETGKPATGPVRWEDSDLVDFVSSLFSKFDLVPKA